MSRPRRLRDVRRTLAGRLPKPFWHHDPPRHQETQAERRRRLQVVGGVSVLGAGLLGVSLSTRPGSREFYGLTLGVAATWTVGGLLSGPLHLGWIQSRDDRLHRPLLTPLATGLGAFGVFYAAALVARRVPLLDDALVRVLRFADEGATPLVLLTICANGAAEEVFFRGAMYSALSGAFDERSAMATSTVVYTAATLATRNPALVAAAGVMGTLFAAQRRASGGIQASTLTHLTWSLLMLRYLPPLFRSRSPRSPR